MRSSFLKPFLIGLSNVLLFVAIALFLFGGIVIADLAHMDRLWAKFLGIALALVVGVPGFLAKDYVEHLGESKEPASNREIQ